MQVDYDYLKRWLSAREIREIREGNNKSGIKLSRQQTLNIMKGKSKNFPFLNELIEVAKHNEVMSTINT